MKQLTKEELAILTISADIIHDILYQRKKDFVYDIKQSFVTLERSLRHILKRCYGNQSLEDLDEYRDSIVKYSMQLIQGKFELKK